MTNYCSFAERNGKAVERMEVFVERVLAPPKPSLSGGSASIY